MAGTSGAAGDLVALVTASARTRPAVACGSAAVRLGKLNSTCPEIVSSNAGPPPRYGTCSA